MATYFSSAPLIDVLDLDAPPQLADALVYDNPIGIRDVENRLHGLNV